MSLVKYHAHFSGDALWMAEDNFLLVKGPEVRYQSYFDVF